MSDQSPLLGKDISWDQARAIVCRATHLTPFASVQNQTVQSFNLSLPYGLLTVESPALSSPFIMPLTHRDEFLTLWEIFEGGNLAPGDEVLVAYLPNRGVMRFLGGSLPRVRVRVAKEGQMSALFDGKRQTVTEAQVRAWFTPARRCPLCNAVVHGFQLRCAECKRSLMT